MKTLLPSKEKKLMPDKFERDVLRGLAAFPKKMLSKYLYDDRGSRIFEEIMDLPEYYPAKCEMEIFENYKNKIFEFSFQQGRHLDVIDLGAGNGVKAMALIDYFLPRTELKYIPVDISDKSLEKLKITLSQRYPTLKVKALSLEYIKGLELLKHKTKPKLVLFLGSNIGNCTYREALHFLNRAQKALNKDDLLLIGFDLMKDPAIIMSAYNDSQGVTQKFNLNILTRINHELGGNFNLANFLYYPSYNPLTGEMQSFLISKKKQEVTIEKLHKRFTLMKLETIHTENSNKFNLDMVEELAERAGFKIEANFCDSKEYFLDSLWRVM